MKKSVAIILLLSFLFLLFACNPTTVERQPDEEFFSTDLTKDIVASNATPAPLDDPTKLGSKDFCFSLFQSSFSDKKSTLLSPLSVLCALAMATNGAGGETKTEMETLLGGKAENLNSLLYAYARSLEKDKGKLSIANSVWFKESSDDFTADKDFLQLCVDYYDAGLFEAPFDNSTLREINKWVENHTGGKIKDILNRINKNAIMYLINAIYFNAKWEETYIESSVSEGDFTKENGDKKKMDMMYSTERTYLSDETCAGFIKYYQGRRYAFVALLPTEGMAMNDFVGTLTAEKFYSLYENKVSCTVHAALPKFQSEYSVEMSQILSSMGMEKAFDPTDADFGKIGKVPDGYNIYINRVIHKTFINVDTEGTEAAAATVVEFKGTSADPRSFKVVKLDRPFAYVIFDTETKLPVFIGTYMGK